MEKTIETGPGTDRRTLALAIGIILTAAFGAVAWWTRDQWRPFGAQRPAAKSELISAKHDEGAQHAYSHDAHDGERDAAADRIELSDAGLKNIGFKAGSIALQSYARAETLPAMIVERPGVTQVHVTAPFTGVLTEIDVVDGQAVEPGDKMFEIRMTHEELVAAQQQYLENAESLDVVDREIARLKSLGEGVVPGRRVIEQEYEKQKLEASLRASEQALLLHGLTDEQVAEIRSTRTLLRSFTIRAPGRSHGAGAVPDDHAYHVQRLAVSPGQQVEAGQELAVLADHCELFIEGRAFEDDAERLRKAAKQRWDVTARLLTGDAQGPVVEGLQVLFLDDSVDPESRVLRFYLPLPNEIALDRAADDGRRFVEWRFKPGQRMELSVPIEQGSRQIVLPQEAVVEEGAERFVYRQNGKSFERVPVHVEFHEGGKAVVANDGALFPGDIVAERGAYQMHLQLKNKAGGRVDPHAGHSH